MKLIKTYDYGQNTGTMVMLTVLFGIFSACLAWLGYTHKGTMVIRTVIKLNQEQAILLYYVLAVFFALLTVMSAAMAAGSTRKDKKLVIYNDRLVFLGGKEPVTHFFRDMATAKVSTVSTARFIEADMKDGYKLIIAEVNFKLLKEFEEAAGYVTAAVEKKSLQ